MIWYIVIYYAFLCLYYVTETSGKMYLRAPNKTVLASMIFGYALYQFQYYEFASYHLVMIAGLFLVWMGDIFLLFDMNRGGDYFLGGNVCFVLYEMAAAFDNGYRFRNFAWVVPALILFMLLVVWLIQKYPNVIKLGKMKWPIVLYLTSVSAHGLMGLALITMLPAGSADFVLGLGSLIFWISDLILMVVYFVLPKTKWILRLNSTLYFTGFLLIVLSRTVH